MYRYIYADRLYRQTTDWTHSGNTAVVVWSLPQRTSHCRDNSWRKASSTSSIEVICPQTWNQRASVRRKNDSWRDCSTTEQLQEKWTQVITHFSTTRAKTGKCTIEIWEPRSQKIIISVSCLHSTWTRHKVISLTWKIKRAKSRKSTLPFLGSELKYRIKVETSRKSFRKNSRQSYFRDQINKGFINSQIQWDQGDRQSSKKSEKTGKSLVERSSTSYQGKVWS